jgi:hypothetical protein
MEANWKPPFPATAGRFDEAADITGMEASIPLFFRLHYIVKGKFFPSEAESCPVLAETSVPRGETSARLLLNFPLSGIFRGNGFSRLCDIFGFFSFRCGQEQKRTLMIRSSPCFGKQPVIKAQTGAEDRRSKLSADEERYYMREYTPGDRLRDINWKSSEKIDSLITRISTDNQEKITRIEVHFRNFAANVSLDALWLLDRAKAQLAYFLRSLMELNSSFIFVVYCAGKNREIENMDSLDDFLDELAGVSFMPGKNESYNGVVNKGDIYVFSTACDLGLQGFLLANCQRPVTLLLVQPAGKKNKNSFIKTAGAEKNDVSGSENLSKTEILRLRDFSLMGCSIINPRWYKRGNIKPLGVHAGKVDMFYAQIKF